MPILPSNPLGKNIFGKKKAGLDPRPQGLMPASAAYPTAFGTQGPVKSWESLIRPREEEAGPVPKVEVLPGQDGVVEAPPQRKKKGGESREVMRRRDVAWSPVVVYASSISTDGTELSLGRAPIGGLKLGGVNLTVRGTHELQANNYWRIQISLRNGSTIELIAEITTQNDDLTANVFRHAYQNDDGVRVPQFYEVTAKFEWQGSPSALSQVSIQADWFRGV